MVGSLAIASLATILQSRATTHIATARTAITGYQHTLIARAAARSAHHAGAVPPVKGAGHVAVLHETVVAIQHYATAAIHTAMAAAFDDSFMVTTVLAAIGVVLAFTLRRQPVPPHHGDGGVRRRARGSGIELLRGGLQARRPGRWP